MLKTIKKASPFSFLYNMIANSWQPQDDFKKKEKKEINYLGISYQNKQLIQWTEKQRSIHI